ncbi:unnamed protein product [Paramecium sonneborni]|uniref:Uncharacterized protein n=1 Tax=Paramecium sonneborni TaxID=65129 RepID=A0A8S1K3G0_9CILI|nr:unnamed protein product [Paramecium sonneborni]
MYIQYQFEKQRNLDLSFVNNTISKSLEQLYGIIGMAKFQYQIVEIIGNKAKIEIEQDLLQEFWTAIILCSEYGNVKYKCVLIQ